MTLLGLHVGDVLVVVLTESLLILRSAVLGRLLVLINLAAVLVPSSFGYARALPVRGAKIAARANEHGR